MALVAGPGRRGLSLLINITIGPKNGCLRILNLVVSAYIALDTRQIGVKEKRAF